MTPAVHTEREATGDDEAVALLLGRDPGGEFAVVVRRPDGAPMVIANAPFLRDGTPMPTRYWLVDPQLRSAVGRLEAAGGVREAEAHVDPAALAECHRRYAEERDALDSGGADGAASERGSRRHAPGGQVPPRPSGLVARRGRRPGRGVGGAGAPPHPVGGWSEPMTCDDTDRRGGGRGARASTLGGSDGRFAGFLLGSGELGRLDHRSKGSSH